MDGGSNLFGDRETFLTIGGKVYSLTVFKLDDFAGRERYILGLRRNPFDVLGTLPPNTDIEVVKHIADGAMREWRRGNFVTAEEDLEFKRSMHGRAYDFWRAVRPNHPEIDTLQKAVTLLEQGLIEEGEHDIATAMAQVREEDILPNSEPPTTQASPSTPETVDDAGGCTGPRFTGSSSESEDSALSQSGDSRSTGPL